VTQRFAGEVLTGFIQKPYRGSELLTKVRATLTPPPTPDEAAPETE
jgi:hypothetical protein